MAQSNCTLLGPEDIRLVIGCDKTTSYGTAVMSNMSQQRINLKFRTLDEDAASSERPSGSTPLYRWESSGLAEYRVGPDPREVTELKQDDDSNVAIGENYRNLCIFVRTLNSSLRDEIFAAITWPEIEVDEKQQNKVSGLDRTSQSGSNNFANVQDGGTSMSNQRSESRLTGTSEGLAPGDELNTVAAIGEAAILTVSASAVVSSHCK